MCGSIVFPSTKYQYMWSNGCSCMSIPIQWWCSLKSLLLPTHLLSIQHNKVINIILSNKVLFSRVYILYNYPLAPELILHPPNTTISCPDTLAVCPYLGIGGVPLTLNLLQFQ